MYGLQRVLERFGCSSTSLDRFLPSPPDPQYAKMKCMFQFSEHPGSIESAWTDADLTCLGLCDCAPYNPWDWNV